MSSSILQTIQRQFTLYGYSICMILGNIGNTFIIILFNRQRQNACSIYLMSSAIMNDLFLTFNSLIQIISFDYHNPTLRTFIFCKIRYYIPHIFGQTAKTMMILACIDRFMITSERANYRAFSTSKRAKYFLFISIIFWSLFSCHIPIMTTIMNGQCGMFDIYSTIFSIYTIIFVGLFPPIILSIFSYLTYRNMKQRYVRVQPVISNIIDVNKSLRQRDRDLLIIVISEVFVYVITTTPVPFILSEIIIIRYIMSNKNAQYTQIESLTLTIAYLLLLINSAAAFYVYLISSNSFRQDFKQLIINIYRKLKRQPHILPIPKAHEVLTLQNARI